MPQAIFIENGHIIQVVSHQAGNARSKFSKEISVAGLDSTTIQDYDAFLLVGGPGSMDYLNDGLLHSCIRSAFDAKILIGAICFAPNILAKTGILNGINELEQTVLTMMSSLAGKSSLQMAPMPPKTGQTP